MVKRAVHPLPWLLFSAGGVMSAMFLPILLFLFGFAFALEWISPPSYTQLHGVLANPLSRLVLFGVCMLSLVHAAHRLRYALYHGFQIKRRQKLVAAVCYGGAAVGTAVAAVLLWQVA